MSANVVPFPSQDPPAAILRVVPARFVTIELAATMTGLTPAAIRTKIGKGIWLEGRQYVRREGRVFIDMKGYEQWVELAAE
jgi:hypothetical protein